MAKRKRRLNVPLAIGLGVVVVVLTAGGAYYLYRKLPKDPRPYIEMARAGEAEGDLKAAMVGWQTAFRYDRSADRIEWGIHAGDLLWMLGQEQTAGGYYRGVLRFFPESVQAQQRLVELALFQGRAMGRSNKKHWLSVAELARDLIRLDPSSAIGYRAQAVAREAVGTPDLLVKALEDLEKLRSLDPGDPTGYFLAATILAGQPDQPAVSGGPKPDPEQADKLMTFVPDDASPATQSRFRLYQALYQLAVHKDRDAAAKLLDEITDRSLLGRDDQARCAFLAEQLGKGELAEEIYKSWTNDEAAVLAQLNSPPASADLLAAQLRAAPHSLQAANFLADHYLRAGKLTEAKAQIDLGLSLPTVKGDVTAAIQQQNVYSLMMAKARYLLTEADISGKTEDYALADEALNDVKARFPNGINNPEYHRLAGLTAFRLSRLVPAQIHLREALDLLSANPAARGGRMELSISLLMVEVLQRLQMAGAAQELLEQITLQMPQYRGEPAVRLNQAEVAMTLGENAKALEVVNALLTDEPNLTQAKLLKARVLRALNRDDESNALTRELEGADSPAQQVREAASDMKENHGDLARQKLEKALAKDPKYWPAALSLALYHLSLADRSRTDGQAEQAEAHKADATKVLEEFLKNSPDHQDAELALLGLREGREAALTRRREMIEKAESPLERAVRLAGEAAAANDAVEARKQLAEVARLAAGTPQKLQADLAGFNVSLRLGDFDQARQYVDALTRANVDGLNGLTYRARMLFEERRFDDAVVAYRDILKQRKSDAYSKRMLAVALMNSSTPSLDEAVERLRGAVRDNPLDRAAWRSLVEALFLANRQREAWTEAENGLKRLRSDPYLFGVRLQRLAAQEPTAAIAAREDIRKNAPGDWQNLASLAALYVQQNQPDQAEKLLTEALAKVPADRRLQLVLEAAGFYRQQKNPAKGEQLIREYLDAHGEQPAAYQAMAEYLRTLGRFEDAEVFYKTAVSKANDPSMYLNLSDFYRAWEKPDLAIAAIRDAQGAVGEPNAELQRRLAEAQLATGRLDQAAATIAEYRRRWPDDIVGDLLDGGLKLSQGQYQQAIEAFDRVIVRQRETPLAYYWKARALYLANPSANLASAITNLQTARSFQPDLRDYEAAMLQAAYQIQRNDISDAVAIYRQILAARPEHVAARIQLIRTLDGARLDRDLDRELTEALRQGTERPRWLLMAGNVALRRFQGYAAQNPRSAAEQAAAAEKYFREALSLVPASESAIAGLSQSLALQSRWQPLLTETDRWLSANSAQPAAVFFLRARALSELKRPDEALIQIEKGIDLAGGQAPLMQQATSVLVGMGTPEQVEARLDRFVAASPESIARRMMRAQFWLSQKKVDQAVADLEKLASNPPKDKEQAAFLQFMLASLKQTEKRYADAAAHYQQVMDTLGEAASPLVLNNYAYLLADNLGQADKAIPLAERAVRLAGVRDANLLDTLGWCYIKSGNVKQGIVILDEARQKGDPPPVVLYHLACAYQQMSQPADAVRLLNQALSAYARGRVKDEYYKPARDLLISLGGTPPAEG